MKEEIWKEIFINPRYEVSTYGKVRSIDRTIGITEDENRFYKSRIMKSYTPKNRYEQVNLAGDVRTVHSLVATAFVDKPISDIKLEVNHIDFDKTNNYYENLEWVTHVENIKIRHESGRSAKGSKNGASKLKEEDISVIRQLILKGYTYKVIAKRYNVGITTIYNVNKNSNYWKHLNV